MKKLTIRTRREVSAQVELINFIVGNGTGTGIVETKGRRDGGE